MDATAPFVDACRAWRDLIDGLDRLPADARAEALAAHLVHVYAAALRLPPAEPVDAAPPPRPWPAAWPGLGEIEAGPPDTTTLLRGLTADLDRGLVLADQDLDAAVGWWRRTFEARWGTLLCAALPRLHEGLRAVRRGPGPRSPADRADRPSPGEGHASPGADHRAPGEDHRGPSDGLRLAGERRPETAERGPVDRTRTRPPRGALTPPLPDGPEPPTRVDRPSLVEPARGLGLLSIEPAPPERRATGRARAPTDAARGILGVRFEPGPQGLTVTAVHPAGPAAGRLEPGDVLVAIDGMPLAGRDDETVAAALASIPGQPREVQVARGAGLVRERLVPVTADDLPAAPVRLALLVLDRDAAAGLFEALEALGVSVQADAEQEGLMVLSAPAEAGAAVRATLAQGAEQGLWDVLGPA